jgi:lipoyl(octanoyl) transferase
MPQRGRELSTAIVASGRRLAVARSYVRCYLSCAESIGSGTLMASGVFRLSQTETPLIDVIVDQHPNSGVFNMAMDASLLQLAADREISVVRIYEWSEPTVTLGYFQATGLDTQSPFPSLPVVRRLSGGGAILHHHEITYSLVLPATHPARQDPSGVYEVVHLAIISLLLEIGVECQLRSEFDAANPVVSNTLDGGIAEPFLCFLRKNPNDIVHRTSAQRRRKGVTLQHGSIILKASVLAPQVLGIVDLVPDSCMSRFRQKLPQVIAAAIGEILNFREFSQQETSLAAEIAKGN